MSEQNKTNPVQIDTGAKVDGSGDVNASPTTIATLSELRELHNSLKNNFDKNLEQFAPLEKFNDIIAILSARHLSATTEPPPAQPQQEQDEESKAEDELKAEEAPYFIIISEEEQFIYTELIPAAAKGLTAHGRTQNTIFTDLVRTSISKLFDLLIIELRQHSSSCIHLVQGLTPHFFALSRPFYINHYQKEMASSGYGTGAVSTVATSGTSTANSTKVDLSQFDSAEIQFRNKLMKGDYIDAIYHDMNYSIESWAKAEIYDIIGDTSCPHLGNEQGEKVKRFDIRFKHQVGSSKLYRADSSSIAQFDTKTSGDAWRYKLQAGDQVDFLDRYHSWQTGTAVKISDCGGNGVQTVTIGYRHYMADGDYQDELGKFIGKGKIFDETCSLHSIRLQLPYSQVENADAAGKTVWKFQVPNVKIDVSKIKTDASDSTGTDATSGTHGGNRNNKIMDDQDMAMITDPKQKVFATERYSCKSKVFVGMLNKLGHEGAYERILTLIERPDVSIESLHILVSCFGECQAIYHKQFVDNYYERFADAVQTKLLSATEKQLREIKLSKIEEIIRIVWERLLLRQQDWFDLQVTRIKVNLKVGILFLKQSWLEKRIDGAKIIELVCHTAVAQISSNSATTQSSRTLGLIEELIFNLQEAKVLEQFFSTKTIHEQLVKRTGGILKLLMKRDAITEEQLDYVWFNCQKHDSTALEFIGTLTTLCTVIDVKYLTFIANKLISKPKSAIKMKELELMQTMGRRTSTIDKALQANQESAILFFWNYLFGGEGNEAEGDAEPVLRRFNSKIDHLYLDEISAMKAVRAISELVPQSDMETCRTYFGKLVQKIQGQSNSYFAVTVANNFVRNFIKKGTVTRDQFVKEMQEQYQMLGMLIAELDNYMSVVKSQVGQMAEESERQNKSLDTAQLGDHIFQDIFPHKQQLEDRINFIKEFSKHDSGSIAASQLSQIWTAIVQENPMLSDHVTVSNWLRGICDDFLLGRNKNSTSFDNLKSFYVDTICAENNNFANLNVQGYQCIQSFFLLVNLRADKLVVQDDDVSRVNSGREVKNQSWNTRKLDPDQIQVCAKVAPNEMEGIGVLWTIAIDCQEKKVGECVTKMLLQVHTQVDFGLEEKITMYEDQFVASCMQIIAKQKQAIEVRPEANKQRLNEDFERIQKDARLNRTMRKKLPVEERRIIACLSYLKMLVLNSEKDGTYDLIPHSSLQLGSYLDAILITNAYSQMNSNGHISRLCVQLYSSSTLYELKKFICAQLSYRQKADKQWEQVPAPHPWTLRVCRYSSLQDIRDSDNGKTLGELGFKPNETLSVYKKGIQSTSTMPLLTMENKLNERAEFLFTYLFHLFAIKDQDKPDGEMVMGEVETTAFARHVTGTQLVKNAVTQLMTFDSNADGKLTLKDILAFYTEACQSRITTVRDNLANMGFRADLKPVPQPGTESNCLQPRKSFSEMPRWKIAQSEATFRPLISLLDMQSEVTKEANSLINMISTNRDTFWVILNLSFAGEQVGGEAPTTFSWDKIFNLEDIKLTMYNYEIIDSIIKTPVYSGQTSSEFTLRANWVDRFLKEGGFQQLLILLNHAMTLAQDSSVRLDYTNEVNTQARKFVARTLRLLALILQILMSASGVNSSSEENKHLDGDENLASEDPAEIEQKLKEAEEKKPAAATTLPSTAATDDDDEKKNKFEFQPRFAVIVEQIRASNMASSLMEQIDFGDLQFKLLGILAGLLSSNSNSSNEEEHIISGALGLWTAILKLRHQLVDEFFQWTCQSSESSTISNATDFIISGIYSRKSKIVRTQFKDSLLLLCEKASGNTALSTTIHILTQHLPSSDSNIDTSMCSEFFTLFGQLVKLYQTYLTENPAVADTAKISIKDLLQETYSRLRAHESTESDTSTTTDSKLVGMLILVKELLDSYVKSAEYEEIVALTLGEQNKMLHEFFYENLYYLPGVTKCAIRNKCKSNQSRTEAYKLLNQLIKSFKPREMAIFMEDYLWRMIQPLSRPKTWMHDPSGSQRSKDQKYAGIKNLGNICYMISMLQQLFMIPQFRYQLLKAVDPQQESLQTYKDREVDDRLLSQMQRLFGMLELSDRGYADPFDLCFAYKDWSGQPTNVGEQKDAQEFIMFFFDKMEELLKQTSQKYLFQDVFQFKCVEQKICQECGKTKNSLRADYTLSVQVENQTDLRSSIQQLVNGETIEDYHCDGCDKTVALKKRQLLGSMPNVLIVHLQRIVFDHNTFQQKKVISKFDFPNLLSLEPFAFKSHSQSVEAESEEEKAELQRLQEMQGDEFQYRLVGVNIHRGTGTHGHYWSYINTKRGQQEPDPVKDEAEWRSSIDFDWKEFNDSDVTGYSVSQLPDDAFGGSTNLTQDERDIASQSTAYGDSYGKSAYMLIYERKTKSDIREVVQQATNETEEQVKQVDYRGIQHTVPDWVKNMVQKNNFKLMIDRQVFDGKFFVLTKLALKHISSELCMTQHRYNLDYQHNFRKMNTVALKIGHKVCFDFLTRYQDNSVLNFMQNYMASIFTATESHVSFIHRGDTPSILTQWIETVLLEDQGASFFDIMFNCPSQNARKNCGDIVAKAINCCFRILSVCEQKPEDARHPKVEKLRAALHGFLDQCLNIMFTRKCQESWKKLLEFYQMLAEICTKTETVTMYLLGRKDGSFIVDLCDMLLQNESPKAEEEQKNGESRRVEMGDSVFKAPFGPLVEILCHLACSLQTTTSEDEALPTRTLFEDLKDYKQPKYPMAQKVIVTEEQLMFITNQSLIDLVMRQGYEVQQFSAMIAHLCYNNKHLSKQICSFGLKQMTMTDNERVSIQLQLLGCLLKIDDVDAKKGQRLQRKRLEWILGFPFLNTGMQQGSKHVIGLNSLFHDITGEVYTFRSTLNYEKSLLDLLYRYSVRHEDLALAWLDLLADIVIGSEALMDFFSSLPSITYQHARYSDWIQPFLQSQLNKQASSASYNYGYGGQGVLSKDDIIKIISKFEIYQAFLKRKDGVEDAIMAENEEEKQNAGRKILCMTPQPYIICRALDENYLPVVDNGDVSLSISYLKSNYIFSKPTGYTNLAISDAFLRKGAPKATMHMIDTTASNQQAAAISNVNKNKSASSMLRELDNAPQGIPYDQSNERIQPNDQIDSNTNSQHNRVEDAKPGITVVNDQDAEWDTVNHAGVADEGQNQDDKDTDQTKAAAHNQAPSQLQEEQSANLDESFENWTGDPMQESDDLVYKLTVSNMSDLPITYKVTFGHDTEVNLSWPINGIKGAIGANEVTTIAMLAKIRPDQAPNADGQYEIEKLMPQLTWKQDMDKIAQDELMRAKASSDAGPGQAAAGSGETIPALTRPQDWEPIYADTNATEKNCSACTMLNASSAASCFICGTSF